MVKDQTLLTPWLFHSRFQTISSFEILFLLVIQACSLAYSHIEIITLFQRRSCKKKQSSNIFGMWFRILITILLSLFNWFQTISRNWRREIVNFPFWFHNTKIMLSSSWRQSLVYRQFGDSITQWEPNLKGKSLTLMHVAVEQKTRYRLNI